MIHDRPSYQAAQAQLQAAIRQAGPAVALGKRTSNLFRQRQQGSVSRLAVGDFHGIIDLDPAAATVDVAGMTTYEELVAATLPQGFMPAVVPQLRSITVGGAIVGLGIESSSFRYGLVHETLLEADVLLGDGRVLQAAPTGQHADLFHGLPNSYGTLGYVLRARLRLIPVKPYVHLEYRRYDSAEACFAAIAELTSSSSPDAPYFLDGVALAPGQYYLCLGRQSASAPYTSDYTRQHIYYRSIAARQSDYLTIADYLWRWDTDWFWCSKNIPGIHNRLVRTLLGRRYLRSTTYWKLMDLDRRYHLMDRWLRLTGRPVPRVEAIIQDVELPLDHAPSFMHFLEDHIGIRPVWLCPLRAYNPQATYPLYPLDTSQTYVNFGFWDTRPTTHPDGHYNRLIEHKLMSLQGKKSLYSTSYYTPAEFWQLYNQPAYDQLKQRYDPTSRFKDLYAKCVQNR